MSINERSTGYYSTGYKNVNTVKNTADISFTDTILEKDATSKIDYGECAFEFLPQCPGRSKESVDGNGKTGAL